MLKWEIKNGDDKLTLEIQRMKSEFDSWYEGCWSKRCTRERMLSEDSPVKHVYYKMVKTFDEIKKEYPYEALERCSDCGDHVDKWIETEFSFCNEYSCGMYLCKDCAEKVKIVINKM